MNDIVTIRVSNYDRGIIVNALRSVGMSILAAKIARIDPADEGPEVEILREKESSQ